MELEKFDPIKAEPHKIWLIVGPRNTGKTTLMRDLMYHTHKRYNNPMCCTSTKESFDMLCKHMPKQMIYADGFNYDAAENFVDLCIKYTSLNKSNIIVLDDCMYDTKVLKSETMRKTHLNGRHYKITLFNCAQYIMHVPPEIRANIDYVFVMKDVNNSNKRKFYEYFFGMFPNFKTFQEVFDQVTDDYGCLVLDRTEAHKNSNSCVKWYKASLDIPDFQIGDKFYFQNDDA